MENDYTLFIVFMTIAFFFAIVTLFTLLILLVKVTAFLVVKRRFDRIHDRALKRTEKEVFEESEWKRSS